MVVGNEKEAILRPPRYPEGVVVNGPGHSLSYMYIYIYKGLK